MLTGLLYFLAFLLALWIMEKIPGVHYVAKPILESIIKFLHFSVVHSGLWLLWFFRMFVRAHKIFFKHLITPRETINQSEVARRVKNTL